MKVLLLMIVSLILILCYATIPHEIVVGGLHLEKIHLSSSLSKVTPKPQTVINQRKTVHKNQTILFFGDSMVEGLSRRFGDYCGESGHILYSIIWYSSTTERWATSNVLEHLIKEYHPTYLILCLGSNELFIKDLEQRERYITQIIEKVDHLPFLWISPNCWNGDTGIINLIQKNSGDGQFYDSRPLKLQRGSDHYHPTWSSAAFWMDNVAKYMSSHRCASPLYLKKPKAHHKAYKTKVLAPSFKGYS